MEGHEIASPDWFVFFNVMHLSLVQTILYKQHYIKHNAIKLTFAWLAAIFGGETAAFGLSTKIKSILQPKFFLIYLFKNIFVLYRYAWKRQPLCLNCCWGLPIPKKRDFWVPKKTQFLGPNFWRGKDCAPNWRRVFTQFRIFPLIGLNGELPYKNREKEWFRIGWWRWIETWSCLQFFYSIWATKIFFAESNFCDEKSLNTIKVISFIMNV